MRQSNKTKQHTLATFIITNALIDGQDLTETYVANNAYFIFYRVGSDPIAFGGVMGDASNQVYGDISHIIAKKIKQTSSREASDTQSFIWSYINTFDGRASRANVKLVKYYTATQVNFELFITTQERTQLCFKGYMGDTLRTLK